LRYILITLLVISPLSITIFFFLKNKFFKKKTEEYKKLDIIFDNEEYKLSFEKFCEEEYSIENFSFRVDVLKFKKLLNQKSKKEFAQEIFKKYLTEESLLELNTNSIKKEIVKNEIESNLNLKSDLFDSILVDANINLSDTYSRWITTEDFQIIKQQRVIVDSVLVEFPKRYKTLIVKSSFSESIDDVNLLKAD